MNKYPEVVDATMVGDYPPIASAGGGLVWDEVLEYRVWCHPESGAKNFHDGDDYYFAFSSYEEAKKYSDNQPGTEEPIALIRQKEFIDEPEKGKYIHRVKERIAEWKVEWLQRPRRTEHTIPDFMAPDAPENRLDIIRGQT
ncbi:GCN5 family acetyltransferase [Lewinella sp. W8]|uniref:GCN5 family acetyltransferase n=1 Tax=Lewinella sp. W8 TaxID=2528208 RepID=UPI0010671BFD|nr:GCN5 family acetyltransferase [Lewinella sp. W8]MTB49891.1 GCN5 family acetyltransferase [Lewinella sp. W8]